MIRDLSASVRQRLLNRSRDTKRPFQELLTASMRWSDFSIDFASPLASTGLSSLVLTTPIRISRAAGPVLFGCLRTPSGPKHAQLKCT